MNARLLAGASALLAGTAAFLVLRDGTTDNDQTGEDVGRIEVPRGAAALGPRAVEVLSRSVGERGQGKKKTPGYHRSPFIDRVNVGLYRDAPGLLGAPWCCRAVRYAYEVAADELGRPRPFPRGAGDLASVSKWKKATAGHRLFAPRAGALLLLGDTHAALVAKVLDARTVVTVEGNHGDAVAHVKRTLRPQDTLVDVEGYIAAEAAAGPAALGELELLEAEVYA